MRENFSLTLLDISKVSATHHQLQLWLTNRSGPWSWDVRSALIGPRGTPIRSCVLRSGTHADEAEAKRLGLRDFSLESSE